MAQSRQVRDLAWCIQSPALVNAKHATCFPTDEWFADQTIKLEGAPAEPPEHFRLGIHFEKTYQSWLEHHDQYDLLAANLQVQGSDRTLGEFDLIVKVADQIEHWELAVKFYINYEHCLRPDHWFGPDPSDTLFGKVSRLLKHQLAIGETEEAKQLCMEKGFVLDTVRCIVKGRLYHPWQTVQESPDMVNDNHLRGWWLADSDIDYLTDFDVVYLSKKYWLSDICPEDNLEVLDQAALHRLMQTTNQIAPQFALLNEGREISRGFILKPKWFELANASADPT